MKGRKDTFKHIFQDEIVKKKFITPENEVEWEIGVRNRHTFSNCPIEINTETGEAFVYSDYVIPGLVEVGQDEKPKDNNVRTEDIDGIPEILGSEEGSGLPIPTALLTAALGALLGTIPVLAEIVNEPFDTYGDGADLSTITGNWYKDTQANHIPTNCKTDDTEYSSSPYSLFTSRTAPWYATFRYEIPDGITSADPLSYKTWLSAKTAYLTLYCNDTTGDLVDSANDSGLMVGLRNDGSVRYYDGAWTDTGYDYSAGSWDVWEIVFDFDNDCADITLNSVLIANDAPFRQSKSTVKSFHFLISTSGFPDEWYLDDFVLGEATLGWDGKYISVENPAKVSGTVKANVDKVDGIGGAS